MKIYQRKARWGILGAVLLLLLGVGEALEESGFRKTATPAEAIVREWESKKLFGFSGSAMVEFGTEKPGGRTFRAKVATHLWYRPSPGEHIALLTRPGENFRLASKWQGFLLPWLLILGSFVWLADVVVVTRKQRTAPETEAREPSPKE